jgi:hypothetical protein
MVECEWFWTKQFKEIAANMKFAAILMWRQRCQPVNLLTHTRIYI